MLHLKFALNLERLADEMIEAVKRVWVSPFQSPIIIFPDPKLEQWFRLYWVKRCGTLTNFNSMMIDRFLMEILVGDDISKQKLNSDMLQSVILAYLYGSDENGVPNYKGLGAEVTRYLETDGKIDHNHAFDLALRMASLFLEYETSRPGDFMRDVDGQGTSRGILECWKQGKLSDFFDGGTREEWQRKLYSKIFHEQNGKPSLLSNVFEAMNQRKNKDKEGPINVDYLTIPFLYSDCLRENGKFHCERFTDGDKVLPVFIFGLGGMGQFYRVILQKFAEQNDIYAYIQNPCKDFWEDIDFKNENSLLADWGKSGRDNIRLWCEASGYNHDFDETPIAFAKSKNSLLHQVQMMVAERASTQQELLCNFESTHFEDDHSFSLTAAPTREREMQILHSRICKLLAERDENGNPVNRVSDIIVFSPDMDNYRTAIFQAFDQNSTEGLHIPFSIVDSPARASLTFDALNVLCGLLTPDIQTINRPSFFSLMRNPVVQNTRKISDDDVAAWEAWIENIHMYRDRQGKNNDWKSGVRRLLLSRFTENDIECLGADGNDCGEVRPYSDIASANSRSLSKFADAIDSLDEWIGFYKNNSAVTPELLDTLTEKLAEWIAMPYAPEGFSGESIVYQHISAGFDILRYQFDAGQKSIPWECVLQTLVCAAESTEYSCGNLFVNGITFSKFIPNRIIPVKHVFFIGAGSSSFPGNIRKDSLDLRNTQKPWPGDDTPVAKNRYAFLCQFMSASESFHISYMNKNLAKDEDLYPTSIVNDIRMFLKKAVKDSAREYFNENRAENDGDNRGENEGKNRDENRTRSFATFDEWETAHKDSLKNIWPEKLIPLDEKRPYSDLFTPKEWRNKATYEGMVNPVENEEEARKRTRFFWQWEDLDELGYTNANKFPERVSFRDLQKFLQDPFQFRIDKTLDTNEREDDVDPETEFFEPIDFNNLGNSILVNSMLESEIFKNNQNYEEFIRDLKISGELPDGVYGKKLQASCKRKCNNILAQMQKQADETPLQNPDEWTNREKFEFSIKQTIENKDFRWTICGSLPWCNASRDHLISVTSARPKSPSKNPNFKTSKYLTAYIAALALIAQKNSMIETTVKISIYSSDACAESPAKASVCMNSDSALEKLRQIYSAAFIEKYAKAVPADMLGNRYESFVDYATDLTDAWKFFGKRNMFDKRRDVGFTVSPTFPRDWEKEAAAQKSLIDMVIEGKEP